MSGAQDDYPNGPTYNKAVKAFGALVCLESADQAEDRNPCRVVLELYLRACEGRDSANTFKP